MASGTVGVHLDKLTIERLRAMASVENRSPSQIQAVALKLFLDMPSGARRALFAIDGIANEDERQFAAKALGRAALVAYDRIIDARHREARARPSNVAPETDEAVEAEAIRLCRS
jgi:hypothetical protein